MRGKLMVLIFGCVPLFACAKPNYVDEKNPGGGAGKSNVCEAKFTNGPCVGMEWEKFPSDNEYGSFRFTIFRQLGDDQKLEDPTSAVEVVLWMPSMGHGSSPVTVERLGVGTFRASRVFFSMRGEWEIRFQLKAGREVRDQAIIPISL